MKAIAENRRVRFDYKILEKFDAGIELTGHEVKSIKSGYANLTGSYVVMRDSAPHILGMKVSSFQPKNAPADYDSERTKKLLLTKKEINYLTGKLQENLTLVPLRLYTKRGLVKIELGLGRGRKKKDKREYLKKREAKREMGRYM